MWTWILRLFYLDLGFIIVCVLSLLFYLHFIREKHDFKEWGIPRPYTQLGLTITSILKSEHLSDVMKKLYTVNENAKYIGYYVFLKPVIVVRDLDLVKNILVKDFDHFTDRKVFVDESAEPVFLKNLASLNGDKWHEVRHLLSPAFTSSKIKTMFELMKKCAENFTNSFIEQLGSEEEINTKDAFTKYTNDVIATCAFGIETDSIKNPENEFYTYGREITAVGRWTTLIGLYKIMMINFVPKLAKMLNITIIPTKVTNFFVDVIGSVVRTRDEKGITRPDMLQLLMDARGKTSENVKLDIVEMTAQAFVFFLGGLEPTSAQMCLVAHMLTINPEVQEKLLVEIDTVLKETGGEITYDAITHMPYLDAVFQETLRLHPQASLLSRVCSKSYELPPTLPDAKSYTIRPGDEVWIPVNGIHLNPVLYEDPETFYPERFVGKNIMTSGDVTSLGFGLGPRMCIGNRFAILETKVLFVSLLKKCKLQPCKKTCNPLKYWAAQVGPVPKEGFWLKIQKRSTE